VARTQEEVVEASADVVVETERVVVIQDPTLVVEFAIIVRSLGISRRIVPNFAVKNRAVPKSHPGNRQQPT
jgi:hypothetical protein